MSIEGVSPTPDDKKIYKQEYKHAADLFQRALQEYNQTDDIYKREEFKEVMDQAMQVLNETARELKSGKLDEQNNQIEKDYARFQDQGSKETQQKLNEDLNQAKHTL